MREPSLRAAPEAYERDRAVQVARELIVLASSDRVAVDIDRAAVRMADYLLDVLRPPSADLSVFGRHAIPFSRSHAVGSATRQTVEMTDIPFRSFCPHHLLPFFGTVDLSFVPREHVIGLSRLPELILAASRGPQLQEHFANAVADALYRAIRPREVMVRVCATHSCVITSGAVSAGSTIVTTVRRSRRSG